MIDRSPTVIFSDKRVDSTFRYTLQLCRNSEFFTALVKTLAEMILEKSGMNTAETVFINGTDEVIRVTVERMNVQEFRKSEFDFTPKGRDSE